MNADGLFGPKIFPNSGGQRGEEGGIRQKLQAVSLLPNPSALPLHSSLLCPLKEFSFGETTQKN